MIRITHSNCTTSIQTYGSQSPKPQLFTICCCLVSLNDEHYTKALSLVELQAAITFPMVQKSNTTSI